MSAGNPTYGVRGHRVGVLEGNIYEVGRLSPICPIFIIVLSIFRV